MTDHDPTEAELTKEQRILRIMQTVLTDVARDTNTPPGMKHPLTDKTIHNIRDCLSLIVERQQELAEALGQEMNMRPRYVDEPKKGDTVVHINVDTLRKNPKS
ncbi:segregation and condensation protein A [Thioalkalivibrio denitrificans]|uniref:Segregation and condensation protein A n=1 Tax=Thioalkalivibrio denitrificans TaxID=108003 RepID=A0A1V3NM20_9GAMM|nr:segregation and condensation protein A [Thioalkalivibrio denitrificans]OOG25918.1 segregation and condensation protein A [Thioalkalivibrio denitrificans]